MAKRSKASKPTAATLPSGNAYEVTCALIAAQLRSAEALLPQVLDVRDCPEPLHDFRVALRRARSFVSLLGGVYAKDSRKPLADALRRLAAPTGPLRDLDVHLLARKSHLKRLPKPVRADARQVFDHLAQLRGQAERALRAELGGADYSRMLSALREALESGELAQGPRAQAPFQAEAYRSIERRYATVVTRGRALDHATREAQVHRYRIACKKLRYALEFFGPEQAKGSPLGRLTDRLKAAQTQLGQFNDACVQRDRLRSIEWPEGAPALPFAAGMMAGLLQADIAQSRGPLVEAAARLGESDSRRRFRAALAG